MWQFAQSNSHALYTALKRNNNGRKALFTVPLIQSPVYLTVSLFLIHFPGLLISPFVYSSFVSYHQDHQAHMLHIINVHYMTVVASRPTGWLWWSWMIKKKSILNALSSIFYNSFRRKTIYISSLAIYFMVS